MRLYSRSSGWAWSVMDLFIGVDVLVLVGTDGPSELWTISRFAFNHLAIASKGEAYALESIDMSTGTALEALGLTGSLNG